MEKKHTHIGAYGIIIRKNKIALIKKATGAYKGKLDLPGGGIEHNEAPIEALSREIREEIGGTVLKEELFDAASINVTWQVKEDLQEDLHHIGILYIVEIKETILKDTPDGIDSNGADWYEIEKLTKEDLSPFAYYSLKKLKYNI